MTKITEMTKLTGQYVCSTCGGTSFELYWNVYEGLINKGVTHVEIICKSCKGGLVITKEREKKKR